jgi:hypothetical protein
VLCRRNTGQPIQAGNAEDNEPSEDTRSVHDNEFARITIWWDNNGPSAPGLPTGCGALSAKGLWVGN